MEAGDRSVTGTSKPYTGHPVEQAKITRALVRRFGVSMMPYAFRETQEHSRRVVRCTDVETGSWIDVYFSLGRLRVIGEHDGAK